MPEKTDPVKKLLRVPADLVGRVSDYRFAAKIQTETQAYLDLIEAGLEAKKREKRK